MNNFSGRPAAFGAAGAFWVLVMIVVVQGLAGSYLLLGLAFGFIVLGVSALAACPHRIGRVLGGMWMLAVVLFAVYFTLTDLADGLFTLFASAVFGTLAFVAWVALGLGLSRLLLHVKSRSG